MSSPLSADAKELEDAALALLKGQLFYLSPEAVDLISLHLARNAKNGGEYEYTLQVLRSSEADLEKIMRGPGDEEDALFAFSVLLWNIRLGRFTRIEMPQMPLDSVPYMWHPMRWLALCGYSEFLHLRLGEVPGEEFVVLESVLRLLDRRRLEGELPIDERTSVLPDLLNVALPTGTLDNRIAEVRSYYADLRQWAIDRPPEIVLNGWSFGLLAHDLEDRSEDAREALSAIVNHPLNRASFLDFPAYWAAADLFGERTLDRFLRWFPPASAGLLKECILLSPSFRAKGR